MIGLKRIFVVCAFCACLAGRVFAEVPLTSKPQDGSLVFGGLKRTFVYYRPADAVSDKTPKPLLIVLHGGHGRAESVIKLTSGRFNQLADRDHFLVVYPQALEKNWNDGRGIQDYRSQREKIDDVGFISALIDFFDARYGVDPNRVFVTGISNGAMMSCRLACELSSRIAAAAPVSGPIPKNIFASCDPKNPVSMLFIEGTEDPLVPYDGGFVHFFRRKLGEVASVRDSALFWARRDGCATPREESLPDRDPQDGTTVEKTSYSGGVAGTEVILYTIQGGGHTWPGGWRYAGKWLVGRVSHELDACDVIWDFFKAHPRP